MDYGTSARRIQVGLLVHHHDGGNADANIDPDKVIGMIRQYNEALEDKGKEAKIVEVRRATHQQILSA